MRVQVKAPQIVEGQRALRLGFILFDEALGLLRGASQMRYREVRKPLEGPGSVPGGRRGHEYIQGGESRPPHPSPPQPACLRQPEIKSHALPVGLGKAPTAGACRRDVF